MPQPGPGDHGSPGPGIGSAPRGALPERKASDPTGLAGRAAGEAGAPVGVHRAEDAAGKPGAQDAPGIVGGSAVIGSPGWRRRKTGSARSRGRDQAGGDAGEPGLALVQDILGMGPFGTAVARSLVGWLAACAGRAGRRRIARGPRQPVRRYGQDVALVFLERDEEHGGSVKSRRRPADRAGVDRRPRCPGARRMALRPWADRNVADADYRQ